MVLTLFAAKPLNHRKTRRNAAVQRLRIRAALVAERVLRQNSAPVGGRSRAASSGASSLKMVFFKSPIAGARRAALVLTLCAAALTPAQAKVLATVNGAEITDADLATAREDVGSTLPKQMNDQARDKALLDYLIDVKL